MHTPPLDAIDWRLLHLLQHDASMSNAALAKRALTSPATCLRRVLRLKQLGLITAQVALLDADRLGAGLTVFSEITLDRQGAEHLNAFEARAVAEGAVQQCHRVATGPDFILQLQVADMPAWHALVQRLFTQDANVRNVKSFFSVHRAKFTTALSLPTAPAAK